MSELFPSLTMTIVACIIGVGSAYGIHGIFKYKVQRFWFLPPILLVFTLLWTENYTRGVIGFTQFSSLLVIAFFIGLVITPLDD